MRERAQVDAKRNREPAAGSEIPAVIKERKKNKKETRKDGFESKMEE